MSEHKKWLDDWVKERTQAVPYAEIKRHVKEFYAPACLMAAESAGITRRELEVAADGKLAKYLESALEDKWDAQVHKNRPTSSN